MQQSTGLAENWTVYQCISLVQSTMNLLFCLHTGEMHLDKDIEEVAEIKATPHYKHEHRGFHHLWVSLLILNLREPSIISQI